MVDAMLLVKVSAPRLQSYNSSGVTSHSQSYLKQDGVSETLVTFLRTEVGLGTKSHNLMPATKRNQRHGCSNGNLELICSGVHLQHLIPHVVQRALVLVDELRHLHIVRTSKHAI